MTYLEEMKECLEGGRQGERFDTARAHNKADRILCGVLRELGQNELVDLYNQIYKQYA